MTAGGRPRDSRLSRHPGIVLRWSRGLTPAVVAVSVGLVALHPRSRRAHGQDLVAIIVVKPAEQDLGDPEPRQCAERFDAHVGPV